MVVNATFNNISVISWRSVLLVWGNQSTRKKHIVTVETFKLPLSFYLQVLHCIYSHSMIIRHLVIKFVIDLRQIDCFLRVLWFPPLIKLAAIYI